MEIAAIKHVHSEELKQRDAEKATAREHELHLEKQLKILCKADDRILRKKEHNRLLQQAGLVPSEATEAQDEDERLRTRGTSKNEYKSIIAPRGTGKAALTLSIVGQCALFSAF
jgi:hypothetical protein